MTWEHLEKFVYGNGLGHANFTGSNNTGFRLKKKKIPRFVTECIVLPSGESKFLQDSLV